MNEMSENVVLALRRLDEIKKIKDDLDIESQYLQDSIHLILDQNMPQTKEAEYEIIKRFWSGAYDSYLDGGYITNDKFISESRFAYECKLLSRLITKYAASFKTCLDIGCGNGRYTHYFSNSFDSCVGIDLSESRVQANNEKNINPQVNFSSVDFTRTEAFNGNKFDLIFVGDIFMYTHDSDIEATFKHMLSLLSENGILLVRESTAVGCGEHYRSKNYVAYYRKTSFYEAEFFSAHWQETVKNSSYNLYHMDKLLNVKKQYRKAIKNEPLILDEITGELGHVPRTGHFFVYKASPF